MKVAIILPLIVVVVTIYFVFFDVTPAEKEQPTVVEPEPEIVICEEVPPPPFPAHWGNPPEIQTRDYRKLPEPYGFGSSTLSKWIEENQKKDKEL